MLTNSQRRNFGWCVFFIVFATYLFYLLPHKGFDFTDHGFYLYHALYAPHFFIITFDTFINWAFMQLGISEYLAFERIYYFLIVLSMLVFVWGLGKEHLKSEYLPVVLIIALGTQLTFMTTYQNCSMLFLLISLGLLFASLRQTQLFSRTVLSTTSAFLIVFAGFCNISLIPALVLFFFFALIFLYHEKYKWIFLLSYLIFFSFFLIFFMHKFGTNVDIYLPQKYSIAKSLSRVGVLTKELIKNYFLLGGTLLILVLALLGLQKIFKLKIYFSRKTLFLMLSVILVAYVIFYKKHRWGFYLFDSQESIRVFSYACFLIFLVAPFCFLEKSLLNKKYLLSYLAVLMFAMAIIVTTVSPIQLRCNYFVAGFMGVTLFLLYENKNNSSMSDLGLWLFLLGIGAVTTWNQFHYSYRSEPPNSATTRITLSSINGSYVGLEKANLINELNAIYYQYHCEDRYFLAFPSQPLLYYLFKRESSIGKAWIAPTIGNFKSQPFIESLSAEKKWCVFEAQNYQAAPEDYLNEVQNYLEKNSTTKKTITIKELPNVKYSYPTRYNIYIR